MRRKRVLKNLNIIPDPVYNNVDVSKFINYLMWDGKKFAAYKVFYKAMELIKEKTKENELEVLQKAIQNASPSVETKRRRVGGSNTQIPVEISPKRSKFLSMRWLINFSRARSEKTMAVKLANEIISAYNGDGATIKKKEEMHKMAASNRVFASLKVK